MSETQFENEKLKKWLQDNLRIILSIAVVIVIAGLINSYSKRTESQQLASVDTEETELESELSELEKQLAEIGIENEVNEESEEVSINETEEEAVVEVKSEPETVKPEVTEQPQENKPETIEPVAEQKPTPKPEPVVEQPKQEVAQVQAEQRDGQETEESFIETATAGEGLTHLARHALTDYLEKNPDSRLTAEHKIYIEDYLRKNIKKVNGVQVGTSVEFSKSLIKNSIDQAKNLNENQLTNLKKYTSRVSTI